MTPFEALYGRPPPAISPYSKGTAKVDTVDALLSHRDALLHKLKANLDRARHRMKQKADKHRKEIEFDEGSWVYIKLQPYRQLSVRSHRSHKLTRRYYGPFQVSARIGKVAYQLALPANAKVHNVFHVSLLKLCKGSVDRITPTLPPDLLAPDPNTFPERIIGRKTILQGTRNTTQLLIQWKGQSPDCATWEDAAIIKSSFPDFYIEDDVQTNGASIDPNMKAITRTKGTRVRQVSKRYPKEDYYA